MQCADPCGFRTAPTPLERTPAHEHPTQNLGKRLLRRPGERRGVVAWAAKAAGVGRRTVYDHLQADPEFAERWRDALETAADNLEGELIRRAVEGEQVPVYYQGKVVGHKTRKSDTLLMFAIKNLQRRRERDSPEKLAAASDFWRQRVATAADGSSRLTRKKKTPGMPRRR